MVKKIRLNIAILSFCFLSAKSLVASADLSNLSGKYTWTDTETRDQIHTFTLEKVNEHLTTFDKSTPCLHVYKSDLSFVHKYGSKKNPKEQINQIPRFCFTTEYGKNLLIIYSLQEHGVLRAARGYHVISTEQGNITICKQEGSQCEHPTQFTRVWES